jgi:hypothetical protein
MYDNSLVISQDGVQRVITPRENFTADAQQSYAEVFDGCGVPNHGTLADPADTGHLAIYFRSNRFFSFLPAPGYS